MRAAALFVTLVGALSAQTVAECRATYRAGKLADARACFTKLTLQNDPAVRAEGYWGLHNHPQANENFKAAVKARPKDAALRVRWGRLYLDHDQTGDAMDLFGEALEIQADYPPALLGVALAAAENFDKRAVEMAEKALAGDPKLVEAHELLARLALEDSDPKRATEQAQKALALAPDALDAMTVLAAIDLLDDKADTPWLAKIAARNPNYGEAHGLLGHFFILNRRYEEGIRSLRRALELNPELWAIRAELGISLMRMGEEKEAQQHLEACFNAGFKGNTTVNSLRLIDSYKRYETFRTPRTIIRLDKKEAALLRPYVQAQLDQAIDVFEKKYKFKLDLPVQLEIYPNHDDFAVRTMGMPGLGALGVTFGYVVAMDSPSARQPGKFHWASVLWHELSHVFTLTATKHRVPRWFTEGMAVHEESATYSDWGDRLDFEAIKAIQEKKLLPIAELDRGFVRPKYPSQVVVSYFQAGKICDFIVERWGFDKLLDILRSFSSRTTTAEVIEKQLALKPEDFDREFLAWLDRKVGPTVKAFDAWKKGMQSLAALSAKKQYADVVKEGPKLRDQYTDFVEDGNAYEMIADAHFALGQKDAAAAELERYARIGGRNPATLKKLAGWQSELGRKANAARTLDKINLIYPQDEELHRTLGGLWMEAGEPAKAAQEYEALVGMKPQDVAGTRFLLAQAYQKANRWEEAKEQVLLALEAAPGYRPAQKLLLELNRKN
jgi:tetratricopeptide (TPR) repeat protein